MCLLLVTISFRRCFRLKPYAHQLRLAALNVSVCPADPEEEQALLPDAKDVYQHGPVLV